MIRGLIRMLILRPLAGVALLLTALVAVVAIAVYAMNPGLPRPSVGAIRLPGMSDSPGASASRSAPQATENYLKGNQTFNAELMWSALATEAQERFRSRGSTLPELQRQMESARDQGTQLDEFSYVGGQGLPDGTSMHFYLVLTKGPQSRSDPQYVPYVFTLDRAGKISRVQ